MTHIHHTYPQAQIHVLHSSKIQLFHFFVFIEIHQTILWHQSIHFLFSCPSYIMISHLYMSYAKWRWESFYVNMENKLAKRTGTIYICIKIFITVPYHWSRSKQYIPWEIPLWLRLLHKHCWLQNSQVALTTASRVYRPGAGSDPTFTSTSSILQTVRSFL